MPMSSRHIQPTAGQKHEQIQHETPFSTAMALG
jgi:hypothetical protein